MEEELLNNGDKILKALQKQQSLDVQRTGLRSEFAYSTNRRDVGKDFDDFNKFDRNVTLGIDQNTNRAINTNRKMLRSIARLPRNIAGEVLSTVGAGVQLASRPGDTISGNLKEVNPLAEWLMDAGKELSQGDQGRLFSLYTEDTGVFDVGDADWWAKTIEGWGPTVGMMVASLGSGALVKAGSSAVTKGVAGSVGRLATKRTVYNLAKQEAKEASEAFLKTNLKSNLSAVQRKAVKDQAKAIESRTRQRIISENAGNMQAATNAIKNKVLQSPTIQSLQGTTQTIAASLVSRNAETFLESKQTYDLVYERSKQQYPERSEEEHRKLAAEAASTNYKNGMWLALIDIYQYSKLAKMFDRSVAPITKSLKSKLSTYIGQAASEGLEETYQYTVSKQAQEASQRFREANVLQTYFESVRDKEFQESFVQGALGGIIFQGAGDTISKLAKLKKAEEKKENKQQEQDQEIDKEVSDKKEKQVTEEIPVDIDLGDDMINFSEVPNDLEIDAPEDYNIPMDIDLGDDNIPQQIPNDIDLGDDNITQVPNDIDLGEEGYFPTDADIPDVIDGEMFVTADTFADDANLRDQANEEFGTNFNEDSRNNYEEQVNLERNQLLEQVDNMRSELKKAHPKTFDLAEAVITKNAIKKNKELTSDQKKELIAPHQAVINEHKEKGNTLSAKQISGYKKHRKLANDLVNNKVKELNSDKVKPIEQPSIQDLSDDKVINLSKTEGLSEEGKERISIELQSRKQTPEIERALQQLNQEPITEAKKAELGIDSDDLIGKTLEFAVNKIGNNVNVQKGDLNYDYNTNTLTFPEDATAFDKAITIAKELAKQNDPVVKQVEKLLSDNDINIPFTQAIDQIFNDNEFAIRLMNTPSDVKTKSLLDRILEKLMELLGIADNNLFNEVLSQFYNAIPGIKQDTNLNQNSNIDYGNVTNIVSPYRMLTYKNSKAFHRGQEVEVKGKRNPYIIYDNQTYLVAPQYKTIPEGEDKRVTILTNENGTPAMNGLYSKAEIENMKKDIPYNAELEMRLTKDTGNSDTAFVELYYNNTKVGNLSGWFSDNGSQEFRDFRTNLYAKYKANQPLGTITFIGSQDNIISTSQEYKWDEVLPSDQLENPRIGVITRVNKEISEYTGYPVGSKLIQFDIDDYVPYKGSQADGKPVMYVKNSRGIEVPIQGESMMFKDSEKAQEELFNIIETTSSDKLQEAIRSMVRWSQAEDGYTKVYPNIYNDFKERYTKKQQISTLEKGDYIILPEGNAKITEDREISFVVELKDGNTININKFEQVTVHSYTTFVKEQKIMQRPIQLDRNKLTDVNYLKSKKDYFYFNVIPGAFGIPERKVSINTNTEPKVQETESLIFDNTPIETEAIEMKTNQQENLSDFNQQASDWLDVGDILNEAEEENKTKNC